MMIFFLIFFFLRARLLVFRISTTILLGYLVILGLCLPLPVSAGLTLQTIPGRVPTLIFNGRPILAYGPSPQNILTYLPRGQGNDYQDWASWAEQYGIRNARSYPPSIIVDAPALNLFERAINQPEKFDLTRFSNDYFQVLRQACQRFEQAGVIVHLQLWQAVYWKKAWPLHYYNPINNVNPDISRKAGPGEFCTTSNPILLAHQIEYVRRVLDATADIGNVFYDIMNEIGNGTAKCPEWINAILQAIIQWENERGIDILVTINDEGGRRLEGFSLTNPRLDLIIKDLGQYEEHIEARQLYRKPTVSVRNIDWNHERKERLYFFGLNNLEVNTDPGLQIRGRKYWWRMYMAGVVAAAGYADATSNADRAWYPWIVSKVLSKLNLSHMVNFDLQASYRLNTNSEVSFMNFRRFIEHTGQNVGMQATSGHISGHPIANSYGLQNNRKAIIYFESPNGEAGHHYRPQLGKLKNLILPDGTYNLLIYHPATGDQSNGRIDIHKNEGEIRMPEFKDDLVLLIN